ncbi:MAG: 2Fe-2S iron-sulfur cluster-binding protein [Acidimicrobiia bacterium]|nr:2Fe-2S iron-sulfur cluster-binding protein [Acidimicrobiia bacterium]
MSRRLPPRAGEVIDRNEPVRFTWNGAEVTGYRRDTIVSALAGAGERIFSRSMKYHRPRGILTADYWDPNCRLQVGDEPNVRAAHRLVDHGMAVSAQNAWPSLDFDVRAANNAVSRFLTAGFYYKTFMKPARLWPAYERVLATFAPGGTVDLDTPHGYYDKRYAHPDVVVAGGGPAGLAAALAAADTGARVMLVEHDHRLGGHLLIGGGGDRAAAAELVSAVTDHPAIEVLLDSTVTGRYDDNWTAIVQRSHPVAVERLIKARAKVLVVAPGLIERPYVFGGNDRPGVMLSGAARRLIELYSIKPGDRAVVLSGNTSGDAAVRSLESAGVQVVRVVDARIGETVVATHGSPKRVEAVELADGTTVDADLLVTAIGWTAPTSLLNMAGDRPVYDEAAARFVPGGRLPDTVLATGGLVGDGSLDELVAHGRATGELAARRAAIVKATLQAATARARPPSEPIPEPPADDRPVLHPAPHPPLFRSASHGIVDYSEDVNSKDLVAAAAEGYDSVELIKRFTTSTMGPEQGKLETVNTVAVLAEARGESIGEVGTTVWRPPFAPITLGALGGRVFEPTRVSSIHAWHEANGMTPILAGQWIRPEHYGDPAAEVLNVRTNVGIIDVTPLGKLDLRGADVPRLLNLLYTNKWMQLPVGGVRYGVMCAEDGVVMDDGVTGRLGDDRYLMTTTSSGEGTVWEWAENWLQTLHPEWDVVITPVTTAFTSINVAGPRSRELLGRLTDVDLSPDAFGYMNVRLGSVAGVDGSIMWRIGFTGELSYELHVPAGHGLTVWEALLDRGADLGVAPFGLEAQRIMRLEKGHFIVGQDTDGLTRMPSTGLEALIRLDKDDFAGKPELAWALDGGDADGAVGPAVPRIVAIQPTDPNLVPAEACQVVRAGTNEIVGRITSSRFSPTLERSICLGQVLPEATAAGTVLTVVLTDGTRTTATVMAHHAHFDPEGARLRV